MCTFKPSMDAGLEPDSYLDCDWSAAGHVTRPGAAIGWMLEPDG